MVLIWGLETYVEHAKEWEEVAKQFKGICEMRGLRRGRCNQWQNRSTHSSLIYPNYSDIHSSPTHPQYLMSSLFITFCVPCKDPPASLLPMTRYFSHPSCLSHTQYPLFPRQLTNPWLLWRWRQQAPSKCWQLHATLHDMIFQKTPILYVLFYNNTGTW